MPGRILISLMLLIAAIGCSEVRSDDVKQPAAVSAISVERIEYKGWKDCWRIRNASCELVVVPAVSRVMHFSLIGGKNVLWEDPKLAGKTVPADDATWHNIGGEKLWPTQQKDLFKKYTGHDGWPPPWPWDAGPSRAEPLPNGLRMILPDDKRFGAHSVREFTLDEKEPLVHVRQWIEKTEGEPAEMTVWTVCQVNNPVISLLPSPDGKYSDLDAHSDLMQARDGYATVGRDKKAGQKIGIAPAGQNGWVASICATEKERVMFLQSHKLVAGGAYPDGGLDAEIYTSPTNFAYYTEMELLSPLVAVKAGEKLEDDAIWQLLPVGEKEYVATAEHAHRHALEQLEKP